MGKEKKGVQNSLVTNREVEVRGVEGEARAGESGLLDFSRRGSGRFIGERRVWFCLRLRNREGMKDG